jgi:hypothetical protein
MELVNSIWEVLRKEADLWFLLCRKLRIRRERVRKCQKSQDSSVVVGYSNRSTETLLNCVVILLITNPSQPLLEAILLLLQRENSIKNFQLLLPSRNNITQNTPRILGKPIASSTLLVENNSFVGRQTYLTKHALETSRHQHQHEHTSTKDRHKHCLLRQTSRISLVQQNTSRNIPKHENDGATNIFLKERHSFIISCFESSGSLEYFKGGSSFSFIELFHKT